MGTFSFLAHRGVQLIKNGRFEQDFMIFVLQHNDGQFLMRRSQHHHQQRLRRRSAAIADGVGTVGAVADGGAGGNHAVFLIH